MKHLFFKKGLPFLAIIGFLVIGGLFGSAKGVMAEETPAVTPTTGVTPVTESTVTGVETFEFGFKSATGALNELELDMYFDEIGTDRKYNNSLSFNLPADDGEIEAWIGTVVDSYGQLSEDYQNLLKAAGYVVDATKEVNKLALKLNIFYTAKDNGSTGTWTLKFDTAKLGAEQIEFLVAVKDSHNARWGANDYTAYPNDVKAYVYNVTQPAVIPTTGVTPTESTVTGVETFKFGFESATGALTELELDMYFDAIDTDRNYNNSLSFNLPADNDEIETWIENVVVINNYSELSSDYQNLLKAAGYVDGSNNNAEVLKSNIFYKAEDEDNGTGTWTLKFDTAKLGAEQIEFLVAVKDSHNARWGANDYTAYPNDVKAYVYNVASIIEATSSASVKVTSPTQPLDVTIPDDGLDVTIDYSALKAGEGVTYIIPQTIINSTLARVDIPASSTISSVGGTWNGVLMTPRVTTVELPAISGQNKTVSSAIELGFSGAKLSFDKAVKITMPGEAGKRAGYSRTGDPFVEITNVCSDNTQAVGDALAADSDCKIDVNGDLIIWTKHFTKFATYTQTPTPVVPRSGGGGGGSIVSYCSTVTYGDWGNPINGFQYRELISSSPNNCTLSTSQQIALSRVYVAPVEAEDETIVDPVVPGDDNQGQAVLGEKKYADGTLIRFKGESRIYVIVNGDMQAIRTLEELRQYAGQEILNVTREGAANEVLGAKKYADGTLIRFKGESRIYVIVNGDMQAIRTLEELRQYAGQEILNVEREGDQKEVLGQKRYGNGTLLRASDMKIYLVVNGQLQHLRSLAELRQYAGQMINSVSDSLIADWK